MSEVRKDIYNHALLDNMAHFADAVWAISIPDGNISVLHDIITPESKGTVWSLEAATAEIVADNNPEDREKFLKHLSIEYLSNMKSTEAYESTGLKRNGEVHTLKYVMTPDFDQDGKVICVYISFVDIHTQLEADKVSNEAKVVLDRLMSAFANTEISTFVFYPQSSRVAFSTGAQSLYGFDKEYLNAPGDIASEIVSEDDRDSFLGMFSLIGEGAPVSVCTFHGKDSEWSCKATLTSVKNAPDGSVIEAMGILENYTDVAEAISEKNLYQEELKRYLNALSCGIIQYKKSTNEVVFVNTNALDLLGYSSKEELVSDCFGGVVGTVVPEDAERIQELVQTIKPEDSAVECEYRVIHRDGTERVCYGTIRIILQGDEEIVQRSMIDITEFKKASNELGIIHAMSTLYFVVYQIDLKADIFDIISVNDKYGEMLRSRFGTSGIASNTLDKFADDIEDEASRQSMKDFCNLATLSRRMANNSFLNMEFYSQDIGHCRASFIVSESDDYGCPSKILFLVNDINEEKHREEQYIQDIKIYADRSREFFSMLNNIVGCATWYVYFDISGQDATVNWGNSLRKMIGYNNMYDFPDKMDSLFNVIHPDDRIGVIKAWNKALYSNYKFDIKYRIVCKNGNVRWFRSQGTVMHYDSGAPRLFFGTSLDIEEQVVTEQKAIEAEKAVRREAESAKENLEMLTEITDSGLWYAELDSQGNITKINWSANLRGLLGYVSEAEFPNTIDSWINILHPSDRADTIVKFRYGVHESGISKLKFRCQLKNGEYNVFQSIGKCYRYADGSPRIYAGIFINVTEAEREASDINGRLDALIGGVNGGLAICNNDPDYTYYFTSESVAAIQGYTVDDLMEITDGKSINNICPDDVERAKEEIAKQCKARGTYSVKYRVKHKDGHYIWTHDYGKIVTAIDGNEYVYSLIQNIDEQERAAELLNIERMTFRDALTKNCFYSCNLDLTEGYFRDEIYLENGMPLFASAGIQLPVSFDEQLSSMIKSLDCDFADDISRDACTREGLLRIFEEGNSQIEAHIYSKSKDIYTRLLFLLSRNPVNDHVHVFSVVQDETETMRKELESKKKLKENIEQIQKSSLIIDALSQDYANVYICHVASQKIQVLKQNGLAVVNANLSKQRVFSYDSTWRKYIELAVHPDDKEMIYEAGKLERVMKELETKKEYIHSYRTVNRGLKHFQFKFIRFSEDQIIGGFRDITDIVENEVAQRQAVEEALALAQNANEAKTIFLNNMSHDIRTPMNAIVGYTSLANEYIDDRERISDYLGKIQTSSNHLLNLINDVLDMSRIESGKMNLDEKPNSLMNIVRDISSIVSADADDKGITFETKVTDVKTDYIYCDRLRLNRILLNGISNAIKFTPEGGKVEVEVIQLPDSIDGFSTFTFSVKDTGIGMSKEFIEKIYEPFEREKTSTVSGVQGTGLGMSITKSLVDLMGGTIEIQSELGVGTQMSVTITFKNADDSVISDTRSDVLERISTEENALNGLKILVVEDNELNREIAEEILSIAGAEVTVATDGVYAVEALKNAKDGDFDIVLMDVQMPVMNGYEATKAIRSMNSHYSRIPIIAMTANAFDEDKREAIKSGMDAHVSKPIDIKNLIEVIHKMYREYD